MPSVQVMTGHSPICSPSKNPKLLSSCKSQWKSTLYTAYSLFGMSVRFGCLMQGVQTFFTTNHEGGRPNDSAAHLESWGFYPDAKPVRSFYDGDPRAAIAPFQAYRSALLIPPQIPVDCTKPCLSAISQLSCPPPCSVYHARLEAMVGISTSRLSNI